MKTIRTAVVMMFLAASCSRPGPTTRSFERSDITGVWRHRDTRVFSQNSYQSYSVSVNLREDGVFDQVIQMEGDPVMQKASGTWELKGSRISLSGLLTDDWDQATDKAMWKKADADWWFVDWQGGERRVALFGGLHPDPDSFAPWTKDP